jgi:SAM-dependent methyltransferase
MTENQSCPLQSHTVRPNYGVDAPGVIRNLAIAGLLLLIGGTVPHWHLRSLDLVFNRPFRASLLIMAAVFSMEAVLMLLYAKVGKFGYRDRMLARVEWKGSERVLDVGTGRGLLLIGAAKKLTTGKATGIDIWSAKDLSGNAMENTLRNAELEGVKDKVELLSEDAQKMSFPDASFDIVVSNLCIHNIPTAEGRSKACQEIARVLKPGGTALISDFMHTATYRKAFEQAGLKAERSGMDLLHTFPPLRIVTAKK